MTEPTTADQLAAVLVELGELGACWLEAKAGRKDTAQLDAAIDQVTRESRRLERKLRRETTRADHR